MVHIHNGNTQDTQLLQKNDIIKSAMELDKIILSEKTQTQKDIHGIYSFISGY